MDEREIVERREKRKVVARQFNGPSEACLEISLGCPVYLFLSREHASCKHARASRVEPGWGWVQL